MRLRCWSEDLVVSSIFLLNKVISQNQYVLQLQFLLSLLMNSFWFTTLFNVWINLTKISKRININISKYNDTFYSFNSLKWNSFCIKYNNIRIQNIQQHCSIECGNKTLNNPSALLQKKLKKIRRNCRLCKYNIYMKFFIFIYFKCVVCT